MKRPRWREGRGGWVAEEGERESGKRREKGKYLKIAAQSSYTQKKYES